MITAILSLLGSSAFGSIIGGIFAFLNKKSDLDVKRMELDHEVARWGHDLVLRDKDIEYAKTEAEGRHDVAVVEGDAAIETARMVSIGQAQAADTLDAATLKAAGKYRWMLVVGGAMRACIRPVLTVIIAGASIYLNWLLIERLVSAWPTLTQAQQYDMGMQAFAWVTGQASAVIGYWFVSRGTGK